jgi:hypothetical protein
MSLYWQSFFFALAVLGLLAAALAPSTMLSPDGRVRVAASGAASAWFVFCWNAIEAAGG